MGDMSERRANCDGGLPMVETSDAPHWIRAPRYEAHGGGLAQLKGVWRTVEGRGLACTRRTRCGKGGGRLVRTRHAILAEHSHLQVLCGGLSLVSHGQ